MKSYFMKVIDLYKALGKCKSNNAVIKNLCGDQIGEGLYRDVFEIKHFPSHVIKVEKLFDNHPRYNNICEWRNWADNKDWVKFGPYLADCLMINQTGSVLVQRKIKFKGFDQYPDKIPSPFTDLKYQNFGWIGKRFVCCDYAFLKIVGFGMRQAKWWDASK